MQHWRLQTSVDYCLQKEMVPGQDIPLIKLHGSINWGRCKNCKDEVVPWAFGDFYGAYPPKNYNDNPYTCPSGPDEVYVQIGSAIPGYRHICGHMLEIQTPVIVAPTWAKTEYNTGFDNLGARREPTRGGREYYCDWLLFPPTDQFFPMLYISWYGESSRSLNGFGYMIRIRTELLKIVSKEC